MAPSPFVSIVMAVYNGEKFLREAIESILNQSFKNFEFLIINDGSTDRTQEILERYKDKRIKIITNEKNMGLTKSLNIGLKIAEGEFIARQDADDISLPERIEKQIKFLRDNPDIALVGTQYILIDEKGRKLFKSSLPLSNEEIKEKLDKYNVFCHGSVMFRKQIIEKVGLYNENFKYSQDYELWRRISRYYKVANIPEYLYKLRVTKNSISTKKGIEQKFYMELAKKPNISNLKIEKPEIYFTKKERKKIIYEVYFQQIELAVLKKDRITGIKLLINSLTVNPKKIREITKAGIKLLLPKFLKDILKKWLKFR